MMKGTQPVDEVGQRKMHYGELVLSGMLLIVLVAIAVLLAVLIRAENRQEDMLIHRNVIFHRIEMRQAVYYNSKAANLSPEERRRIEGLNAQAGIFPEP